MDEYGTRKQPFKLRSIRFSGPPPLGEIELPLRSGLTALYGLNGVGKSRILDRLGQVLRDPCADLPEAQRATFVLDVVDEPFVAALFKSRQAEWRKHYEAEPLKYTEEPYPWHSFERGTLDAALGDAVAERWLNVPGWISSWGDKEGLPRSRLVIDEAVRNCDLVARWDADANEFCIEPTIRLGVATPLLNDLYERCRLASVAAPPFGEYFDQIGELNLAEHPEADNVENELFYLIEQFLEQFPAGWFFPVFGIFGGERVWPREEILESPLFSRGAGRSSFRLISGRGVEDRWARLSDYWVSFEVFQVFDDNDVNVIGRLPEATLQVLDAWASADRFEPTHSHPQPATEVPAPTGMLCVESGEVKVASWVKNLTSEIAATASRLFGQMLPDAPELRCEPTPPNRWPTTSAIDWYALDVSGARVPLDQLSAAQVRLAGFAIFLSLAEFTDRETRREQLLRDAFYEPLVQVRTSGMVDPWIFLESWSVLLLDEPEAGVHTLAQQGMATALHQFGRDNDIMIVAATHSRAFLTEPDVNLFEVFRDVDGRTTLREVEFPEPSSAEALGVNRADLLQMYRLVLLVEGLHDQVVFDELLRGELRRRYVLVLPLRGAAGLKGVIDLQLLTDTLSVPVLIVLDGTRRDRVDDFWGQLASLSPDDSPSIDALINTSFAPKPSDEERQVVSLARRLHERAELGRFNVFGLSSRDIVEYLPVQQLVPGADSWNALHDDYDTYRATTSKGVMPFKPWLQQNRSASFGDDSLRIACAALGATPTEFLEMLARIDTIGDNWRRG